MQIMNMAKEFSPRKSSRRAKSKLERKKLFLTAGGFVLFQTETTVRSC